jgi:trehalose synthase
MIGATSDLWWKNAVIYCLDIETFKDSNGDGCGDLQGLISKVDYLAALGVTCIWLMPFFQSPEEDDGYDISDFYSVREGLGDLGDFTEFVRTSKDRGIRVIADLVVNHTSEEHPWFQEARSDPDSPYRDFYVWRDERPEEDEEEVMFPDEETSRWGYDRAARKYYLHSFYSHQPDLDISQPRVKDEIAKIMGFWLQQGLSGFRVDSVPFLIDIEDLPDDVDIEPHRFLADLRKFLGRRSGDAILLGEVNVATDEQRRFFVHDEHGDQLNTQFNFALNQRLYLAFARGDSAPARDALKAMPSIPEECQWANFLRNHDELSLDQLSGSERKEVFEAFGSAEHMQIFDRGLRRRLPPMFDGDQKRLRMAYSLMFSLPGAPVLFYGEEIGMGENLDIEGRMSVRTPMQWSPERTAGFSSADPEDLNRPLVEDERYGPAAVNVADQSRDRDSLLTWMRDLIRARLDHPEIGWGSWKVLEEIDEAVLGMSFKWREGALICLHNLSSEERSVDLEVPEGIQTLTSTLDGRMYEAGHSGCTVNLEGYGYRWLRYASEEDRS